MQWNLNGALPCLASPAISLAWSAVCSMHLNSLHCLSATRKTFSAAARLSKHRHNPTALQASPPRFCEIEIAHQEKTKLNFQISSSGIISGQDPVMGVSSKMVAVQIRAPCTRSCDYSKVQYSTVQFTSFKTGAATTNDAPLRSPIRARTALWQGQRWRWRWCECVCEWCGYGCVVCSL